MMTTDYPRAGNRFYAAPNYLLLFEQLNIAKCAAELDRFDAEYESALAWKAKRLRV
jgi:hypothetical protein